MNTITELKTFKGYPHYLTQKGEFLTLSHNKKVNIGDGFTFGQHYQNVDKKQSPVFRVVEILEERSAKGKHSDPNATFYSLRCEIRTEDISELELLVSVND